MATTRVRKLYVDHCDTCGRKHEATYSHQSQWSDVPVYAVVCTRDYLTDYYLSERVAPRTRTPRATY